MAHVFSQNGGEVPFSCTYITSYDDMEMTMIRTGGFDSIVTSKTNSKLTPTDKTLTEIITLEDVFSIIKNKVTNSTVYNVSEICLGYIDDCYEPFDNFETQKFFTHPVWNVTLNMGTKVIIATVDAKTGELYLVERDYR